MCVLSDFITICIMFLILLMLIDWLFDIEERGFLFLPLGIIIYYLTYYISTTQFEYNFIYENLIVNVNLVFQYIIPMILGLLSLLKHKNVKKQF